MKKYYNLILISFLIFGCSSYDYKKIREKENEKFFSKEIESKELLKKYGTTLSLDEVLKIGEVRNISLKIKNIEYEISKLDKNIAFSNFLPKVNSMISYNQVNHGVYGQIVGAELPIEAKLETRLVDKNFYVNGISATVPIFTPTAWYLYEARKKGVDISAELLDYEKKGVKVQIITAYYHILSLTNERKYLLKERSRGVELVKNSKVALETNSILEWENEQSKQFLKSKDFALNKNLRDLKEAKMQLLTLLDLYPLLDIEVEDKSINLIDLDLSNTVYSALENNSILKIYDIKHGVDEDQVKMAIAAFLPNIALTAGYTKTNNTAIIDPTIIQGSVSGALSIFNGFENINNYKKSKKNLEISELERSESSTKVVLETINAFNLYENSKELYELATGNYNVAKGRLYQKSKEKEVNIITEEEHLKALAEYEEAYALKKNSEYKYQIALAVLEFVTGGINEKK